MSDHDRTHETGRQALGSTGTEFLDWQEIWCMTCKHDHEIHEGPGPGCEVVLRVLMDEPAPEIVAAGYVIEGIDPATGKTEHHEIPAVFNSNPAAAFCTKWEQCGDSVVAPGGRLEGKALPCACHLKGPVITGHTMTTKGWDS